MCWCITRDYWVFGLSIIWYSRKGSGSEAEYVDFYGWQDHILLYEAPSFIMFLSAFLWTFLVTEVRSFQQTWVLTTSHYNFNELYMLIITFFNDMEVVANQNL
jgi:hypothetical protein